MEQKRFPKVHAQDATDVARKTNLIKTSDPKIKAWKKKNLVPKSDGQYFLV